jgi:hypothetical protein
MPRQKTDVLRGTLALLVLKTLASRLDDRTIDGIVDLVPAAWLGGDAPFADHREHRDAYATWL